ncbi:MAG: hypothetical protein IT204_25860 [Fimbriimonadaceae bacterium]|nr:hypothetical protein [Fimbriimonadaceae bacterium]
MTSRQRMQAILAGEAPDRVAIFEHFWPETLRQTWIPQGFPEGRSPDAVFDYDLRNLGWSLDTTPLRGTSEVLEEDDTHRLTRDGRGATLRYWKHKSGTPEHVAFDCTTPEIWAAKYREPLLGLDLERIDTQNLPERLRAGREGDKFLVYGNLFVFELLRGILGDLVMLQSFLLEPAWVHDFCRVYTDFYKRHYDWIFAAIGKPDGMFIYEDLGFTNGPFCSPATYREVIQPYHTELVDFFHSYDLPVILHSCGDVRQLFGQILETGWDCLQPMEAKAGNDCRAFADQITAGGRRIGFMGNIDVTVLNTNDPAKIRVEVEGKVRGMVQRRAGYCFHSDHSVPPDVDYASYQLAVDVMRECGDY